VTKEVVVKAVKEAVRTHLRQDVWESKRAREIERWVEEEVAEAVRMAMKEAVRMAIKEAGEPRLAEWAKRVKNKWEVGLDEVRGKALETVGLDEVRGKALGTTVEEMGFGLVKVVEMGMMDDVRMAVKEAVREGMNMEVSGRDDEETAWRDKVREVMGVRMVAMKGKVGIILGKVQ
jgi:hypothetical protein